MVVARTVITSGLKIVLNGERAESLRQIAQICTGHESTDDSLLEFSVRLGKSTRKEMLSEIRKRPKRSIPTSN